MGSHEPSPRGPQALGGPTTAKGGGLTRHVPGSQPPFYLIPDPDKNKEDTSIISVVVYGVYIPLSHLIHFCPLPSQNFEENAKDPGDPAKPWIQDQSGFLPIFMGFKSFHQRNPWHIKHYNMDNQAQY